MATRIVMLLSGGGTTLENLLEKIDRDELSAQIVAVISSREDAYGLERARKRNIAAVTVSPKAFPEREAFFTAMWEEIRKHKPDLVVMGGFMTLLNVPDDFHGRIMNVHPSLVPAFCGKGMYGHRVHEAVIGYGVRLSGVTVHFVDNEYDHGPIILQEAVPIFDSDSPESLAQRVQAKEREVYPRAIQMFATGRLKLDGRHVRIS
jgi:phosphoribosylglycinamide formyltransferase-1